MSAYTGVWVIIFIRCHTLVRYAIVWQGLNHFHSRMIKTVAWLTYPTTARHQWESMAAWYTQFPTLETTFKFYMKLRNWIYYWCVSWSLSSIYISGARTAAHSLPRWRKLKKLLDVSSSLFLLFLYARLTRNWLHFLTRDLAPDIYRAHWFQLVMSVNCSSGDEILTTNHRTLSSSHFQWCKINLHVK
jgi:hypothetical protein